MMNILIKTSKHWLLALSVICAASAFPGTSVAASEKRDLTDRAYQAYLKGDFKQSLELYRQAGAEIPEAAGLEYNKGTAHYQLGDFDQALKSFEKATLTDNQELAAGAHYNSGNTYFERQDFQHAVEQYKNALRKSPDDSEARRNLEIALRNLKEQEQKQDEDSEQDQDKQDDQQQDKQQNKEDDQDKKEDQHEQQNQESEPKPDSSQSPPEQKPSQSNPYQMSKEDAERLLNSLKDEERKHQKNKRMVSAKTYNGKAW